MRAHIRFALWLLPALAAATVSAMCSSSSSFQLVQQLFQVATREIGGVVVIRTLVDSSFVIKVADSEITVLTKGISDGLFECQSKGNESNELGESGNSVHDCWRVVGMLDQLECRIP